MVNYFESVLSRISASAESILGLSQETLHHLFWSMVIISLVMIVRRVFTYLMAHRVQDVSRRYIAVKTFGYILNFVIVVSLFRLWFGDAGNLVAYFGLLSAGLAIALQDPVTNFVGWIFISMRKPFVVGDRIQIGDFKGDVIDIRMFQFSLVEIGNWVDADQSTGRIIHVPNGLVFKQPQANYTQGFNFIWDEIEVMITFESNWRKAKEILGQIVETHSALQSKTAENEVRKAARKYLIFFQKLTPIVWTSVADCGVVLTMRYLCEPRLRRSTASLIWEEVLSEFAENNDIDFAYPTTRFYNNMREGKPDARATDLSTGSLNKKGMSPGNEL